MVASVKRAALDAIDAGKPVAVVFGQVKSIEPLEIYIDQKMTLSEEQLCLTRNVTGYKVTVQYVSDEVVHTQTIDVREDLQSGDSVVLLRMAGGQQFVVLDRVVV